MKMPSHPRRQRVLNAAALMLTAALAGGCRTVAAGPAPQPGIAAKLGVELDGLGDGNRGRPFVDLAKTLRPWMKIGGGEALPVDANGWPTGDAATVLFDIRPAYTWAPPIDDPDRFQPDWSGTYKLSFQGQATLGFQEETRNRIANQRYEARTNTTTADLIVPKGAGLVVLTFAQTKRTASSPAGSGITGLRVIRPGYPANTRQTFTNEYLNSLKPFAVLRTMDWLETNHNPGFYGDAGHHALNWADRHLPADATQAAYGGKYGVAWEYAIELANRAGKDLWINIPVAATDDYVRQLALLLKRDLAPQRRVYIEHSNEVWNFGFPQYIYNKLAAVDEVNRGNSPLNNDGSKD